MTFRTTLISAVVLAATLDSGALTLGRVRGTPVLGQPLDLTFDVRLDSPGELACVSADVLQAETAVDPSRVRAVVVGGGNAGQDVTVRVTSAVGVEEPVLTVSLRAGCSQQTVRRYVLLAEPPAELRSAPPRLGALPLPLPLPVPLQPASPSVVAPPIDAQRASSAQNRRPESPIDAARSPDRLRAQAALPATAGATPPPIARPRVARAPAPALPAEPRPRLRLDLADLGEERDTPLRPSLAMPTVPPEDLQRRADAAALWRALNTQPQDVLRDAKRLETLEADVKGLREMGLRNQNAMAQLEGRTADAQRQRLNNPLVLGLAALLALALGLAAWLALRARHGGRARNWWQDHTDRPQRGDGTAPRDGEPSMFPPGLEPLERGVALDVDLSALDGDAPSQAVGPALVVAAAPPVARGVVHPEELFDIQQQADFFVSLGQYDQAVEVLQHHIDEAPARSPLAYLDLLKIFHTLSRSDDYLRVREAFNAIFNGEVPLFSGFSRPGRTLDSYPDVMERIQGLWGGPNAAAVIEDLMFRTEGPAVTPPFELDAYRDLLLLHAIAKAIVPRARAGGGFDDAGGPLFSDSRPAPLSPNVAPSASAGWVPSGSAESFPTLDAAPRPGPDVSARTASHAPLDLDLDLGDEAPAAPVRDATTSRPARAERPVTEANVIEKPTAPLMARMLPDDPTMPSAVSPAEAVESHLIDFDLFDTEGDGKAVPPTKNQEG